MCARPSHGGPIAAQGVLFCVVLLGGCFVTFSMGLHCLFVLGAAATCRTFLCGLLGGGDIWWLRKIVDLRGKGGVTSPSANLTEACVAPARMPGRRVATSRQEGRSHHAHFGRERKEQCDSRSRLGVKNNGMRRRATARGSFGSTGANALGAQHGSRGATRSPRNCCWRRRHRTGGRPCVCGCVRARCGRRYRRDGGGHRRQVLV